MTADLGLAALRAYRKRLAAAGRMVEARAVERCVNIVRQTRQIDAGASIAPAPIPAPQPAPRGAPARF